MIPLKKINVLPTQAWQIRPSQLIVLGSRLDVKELNHIFNEDVVESEQNGRRRRSHARTRLIDKPQAVRQRKRLCPAPPLSSSTSAAGILPTPSQYGLNSYPVQSPHSGVHVDTAPQLSATRIVATGPGRSQELLENLTWDGLKSIYEMLMLEVLVGFQDESRVSHLDNLSSPSAGLNLMASQLLVALMGNSVYDSRPMWIRKFSLSAPECMGFFHFCFEEMMYYFTEALNTRHYCQVSDKQLKQLALVECARFQDEKRHSEEHKQPLTEEQFQSSLPQVLRLKLDGTENVDTLIKELQEFNSLARFHPRARLAREKLRVLESQV
ncbi:hypothetical protein T439DRAFT_245832 [Meredithblackwellia eburnea MCA 4105]